MKTKYFKVQLVKRTVNSQQYTAIYSTLEHDGLHGHRDEVIH